MPQPFDKLRETCGNAGALEVAVSFWFLIVIFNLLLNLSGNDGIKNKTKIKKPED